MANRFETKLAKKTAQNPAMAFIDPPPEEPETLKVSSARMIETPEPETPLREAPRAPQRAEAKTRRLQLLLQPSLYEAVKERAEAEGVSVNEEIGELLRSALGL